MSAKDLAREEALAGRRLDRRSLHRLARLLAPHTSILIVIMIFQALAASTIIFRPRLIGALIDTGLAPVLEELPLQQGLLILLALGLIGLWAGRFVLLILARLWAIKVVVQVLSDLRVQLYAHAHALSMRFFDQTRAGRIVSRVDRDVESLQPLMVEGVPQLLGMLLRSCGGGIMLWLTLPSALIGMLILGPLLIGSMLLFRRLGTAIWGRVNEHNSRVTAHLVESIGGVALIQQTVSEERNQEHYDHLLQGLDRAALGAAWGWGWFMPYIFLLFTIGVAVVVLAGGTAIAQGSISPGQLTECVFYVFLFLGPLMEVGDLFERASSGAAAAQRIFLLLDTEADIVDPPEPRQLPDSAQGCLDIQDLCFRYDEDAKSPWVLNKINLHIEAGSTVAIVGRTGHGKSTLVQLLVRFYDPQEGCILFDGIDIRAIRQSDLRRHIALVLQDNVLFSGTVLANLRLARPEMSDQAIIAAGHDLGVSEVIEHLPQAWYSEVGARGEQLSHGQRQVICLLRAWIANPAILILDEATSAIDVRTEGLIQGALRRLMQGRTAIVVAHRLATVRDADRILVIQDGCIVEDGTHHALAQKNGAYAALLAQGLQPRQAPSLQESDE